MKCHYHSWAWDDRFPSEIEFFFFVHIVSFRIVALQCLNELIWMWILQRCRMSVDRLRSRKLTLSYVLYTKYKCSKSKKKSSIMPQTTNLSFILSSVSKAFTFVLYIVFCFGSDTSPHILFLFSFRRISMFQRACLCVGDDDALYYVHFGKTINSLISIMFVENSDSFSMFFFPSSSSYCVYLFFCWWNLIHWRV